jgi:hypothetical protein
MHAEHGGSMDRAYRKAVAVTGVAAISPSVNAVLISTDSREAGLWLWQGEAPPPPALPRPKSRAQQFLRRITPAAGWAGWIALPAGLALASIAVSMMRHPDGPVSPDTPAVALSSAPSPTAARPIASVLPAEATEAKLDQAQVPSARPAVKITAQGPEPPVVKARAQYKLSRIARKTRASHVRRGPPVPMVGVLTPPVTTWHGGGY